MSATLERFGPISDELGQFRRYRQFLGVLGQFTGVFGQFWMNTAKFEATPVSCQRFFPLSARFRPISGELGQFGGAFGQLRVNSGQSEPV